MIKVLKQTSTELTVGKKPPLFIFWLFLAGFVLVAMLFVLGALGSINVEKLICNRPITTQTSLGHLGSGLSSATCKIVKVDWRGVEISQILIPELQEAKMQTYTVTYSDDPDRTYPKYKVILITNTDEIAFDFSPYKSIEQLMVSDINAFVSNSMETYFEIAADHRGSSYFILILAIVFVLFALLGVSSIARVPLDVACTFDKTLNRMTLKYSDTKVLQHSLNEIADVQVQEWEETYRVNLTLVSGKSLPLTYNYSSGRKEKQQLAECIREFLSLG